MKQCFDLLMGFLTWVRNFRVKDLARYRQVQEGLGDGPTTYDPSQFKSAADLNDLIFPIGNKRL